MRYEIVRRSILGESYAMKKKDEVIHTVKTSNFLPILNRTLGGMLVVPHRFVFDNGASVLYRRAGMATERFTYHTPKTRWLFKQPVAHSYQFMLTNGAQSYDVYPVLSQKIIEVWHEKIQLATIEKISDTGRAEYCATTLTDLDDGLLLAITIACDCLIHAPY